MNYSNGKYILTGEHSVVYGEPALVCELQRKLCVELVPMTQLSSQQTPAKQSEYEKHILALFAQKFGCDVSSIRLQVNSELPQKSGLGSSAAFAHAVLKELADHFSIPLTQEELFKLVLQAEAFVHKNPSGIDPCAVVYGGLHTFQKDIQTNELAKEKIRLSRKYELLLVNSGHATETTGMMVQRVADLVRSKPETITTIQTIGNISTAIVAQLSSGNFDGELLDENQQELEKLGVVGNKAQSIITKITKTGAHAKITGAGGVATGSGWILVFDTDLSAVENLCVQNGWENIKTEVK